MTAREAFVEKEIANQHFPKRTMTWTVLSAGIWDQTIRQRSANVTKVDVPRTSKLTNVVNDQRNALVIIQKTAKIAKQRF